MKKRDKDIQYRVDMDLLKRSLMGIVMYAAILPAVFWPFNFHQVQPELSYTFAAFMLSVSMLRVVHKLKTPALYRFSPNLWRSLFGALSLAHAVVLSIYFAFAIYDERFAPLLNVTMLIMGGVASSAVVALTPWGKFALLNLFVLLTPSVVVSFAQGEVPLAVTILLYMGYTSFLGVRSGREYRRAFEIEMKLGEQTEELEKQAKLDGLTGIYNRRHFNNEIEYFWKLGSREGITCTLLMVDIDHFKSINDSYGHLYGDQCISHVANTIKTIVKRETDTVARFGGEEFAALLTGCGSEHAQRLAEAIRKRIAESSFEFEGKSMDMTVSIGVATLLPSSQSDPNSLIQLADEALYAAKENGRNQVQVSGSENLQPTLFSLDR